MKKKFFTLALLSGSFLTALGYNCIPNLGVVNLGGILGGILPG